MISIILRDFLDRGPFERVTIETMGCPHCAWPILDKTYDVFRNHEGYNSVGVICTNCTYAFYAVLEDGYVIGYQEMLDDPETGGSFLERMR